MAMAFALDRPDGGPIEEEETWLLQSAAAAEAGCSVSAIRKGGGPAWWPTGPH